MRGHNDRELNMWECWVSEEVMCSVSSDIISSYLYLYLSLYLYVSMPLYVSFWGILYFQFPISERPRLSTLLKDINLVIAVLFELIFVWFTYPYSFYCTTQPLKKRDASKLNKHFGDTAYRNQPFFFLVAIHILRAPPPPAKTHTQTYMPQNAFMKNIISRLY